jgi:hypothetical protein
MRTTGCINAPHATDRKLRGFEAARLNTVMRIIEIITGHLLREHKTASEAP